MLFLFFLFCYRVTVLECVYIPRAKAQFLTFLLVHTVMLGNQTAVARCQVEIVSKQCLGLLFLPHLWIGESRAVSKQTCSVITGEHEQHNCSWVCARMAITQ